MKLIETIKFDCDTCNGAGYLYWSNGEDFDVETCDCNLNDGMLFTTKENN